MFSPINILSSFVKYCLHAKSLQLCLTLCASTDSSPPGFSVHGIPQARIVEWVACPPPRDLTDPGIKSSSLTSPACNTEFNPWVGKIPWRRKWQPTPVFLPGEFHGQRSLVGYSPWGHKGSDMTATNTCHMLVDSICKWFISGLYIVLPGVSQSETSSPEETHGPPGTVPSQSTWKPEQLGSGKYTRHMAHLDVKINYHIIKHNEKKYIQLNHSAV